MKPFVNNPELWEPFVEEMETRLQSNYKYLAASQDMNQMLRYQGRIAVLKEMMELRNYVNGI
tara:strand:+ start:499 stop:684 length:186 start_codon:yes stop_codon:yes gene_type:complete